VTPSTDELAPVDLRGLKCPLPALMARRALLRAEPGTNIAFICDDPMAPIDVPHMCAQENFEVVSVASDGTTSRMILRRHQK
jgi:tRNA 2-thiouridine synthesizing protein A